jgi:hypothetical protein
MKRVFYSANVVKRGIHRIDCNDCIERAAFNELLSFNAETGEEKRLGRTVVNMPIIVIPFSVLVYSFKR